MFGDAITCNPEMRDVFEILARVADSRASVLLHGETGTGKDLLAKAIHSESSRAKRPFEIVDCGSLPPSLIESELFGHVRGAFTGAMTSRAGAFERAHGGTVFLDEIGELPLESQTRLLRVLEGRTVRRVGGDDWVDCDIRVIAATTRNLSEAVVAGNFRDDLYFRLAVVSVTVPSLRERTDDIPLLVRRFLAQLEETGTFEPRAFDQLKAHAWRGNVRELRNIVERAVLLRPSGDRLALPPLDGLPAASDSSVPPPLHSDTVALAAPRVPAFSLEPVVDETTFRDAKAANDAAFERSFLGALLARHHGNISAAARSAQMNRNHLTNLARRHSLLPPTRGVSRVRTRAQ